MHRSIATIDKPQFINLQPLEINPLMSACEIKVLYVGENRNRSYISKQTATEMAKTLRGAPIVGYFQNQKSDFRDHGERMIIQGGEIKFECLTKPYGFVAPDARVWFQKFDEQDAFGNAVTREYLMTTGYLWTGQFAQCKSAVTSGKNQSMELDEDTLVGNWATNAKTGMEFFIINDATFSKLCILGDDVEPCFEGASVKAPEVSMNFSLDDNFKTTLFSMMQQLKDALKGGVTLNNENLNQPGVQEEEVVEEVVNDQPAVEFEAEEKEDAPVNPEFKKEDEEDKDKEKPADEEDDKSEDKEEKGDDEDKSEESDDEDDKKKKYELLEEQNSALTAEIATANEKLEALQAKYTALESDYNALVEFKNQIENAKKDELINSFYMLSDEDKQDVIENKSNYSYEDIEAKLSIICVRKRVSFDLEEPENNKKAPMVYLLNNDADENVPAWIKAMEDTQKNRK